MTLTAVASGKVVNLTWSKYTGDYFKYYGIVRSETDAQATLPLGTVPYLYFENVNTLSAVDTTKAGHTYHYRAYAFTDATFSTGNVVPNCQANTILAMSNVVDVTIPAAASQPPVASLPPTQDLGALRANDTLSGVTFNWTGYTGGSYSYYKLVYELASSGKTPSYPDGSPYWAVPPVGATSAGPIVIPPGDYQVRVQAIGYPNGSAYALAQTTVIHVHVAVPASPTPSPAP